MKRNFLINRWRSNNCSYDYVNPSVFSLDTEVRMQSYEPGALNVVRQALEDALPAPTDGLVLRRSRDARTLYGYITSDGRGSKSATPVVIQAMALLYCYKVLNTVVYNSRVIEGLESVTKQYNASTNKIETVSNIDCFEDGASRLSTIRAGLDEVTSWLHGNIAEKTEEDILKMNLVSTIKSIKLVKTGSVHCSEYALILLGLSNILRGIGAITGGGGSAYESFDGASVEAMSRLTIPKYLSYGNFSSFIEELRDLNSSRFAVEKLKSLSAKNIEDVFVFNHDKLVRELRSDIFKNLAERDALGYFELLEALVAERMSFDDWILQLPSYIKNKVTLGMREGTEIPSTVMRLVPLCFPAVKDAEHNTGTYFTCTDDLQTVRNRVSEVETTMSAFCSKICSYIDEFFSPVTSDSLSGFYFCRGHEGARTLIHRIGKFSNNTRSYQLLKANLIAGKDGGFARISTHTSEAGTGLSYDADISSLPLRRYSMMTGRVYPTLKEHSTSFDNGGRSCQVVNGCVVEKFDQSELRAYIETISRIGECYIDNGNDAVSVGYVDSLYTLLPPAERTDSEGKAIDIESFGGKLSGGSVARREYAGSLFKPVEIKDIASASILDLLFAFAPGDILKKSDADLEKLYFARLERLTSSYESMTRLPLWQKECTLSSKKESLMDYLRGVFKGTVVDSLTNENVVYLPSHVFNDGSGKVSLSVEDSLLYHDVRVPANLRFVFTLPASVVTADVSAALQSIGYYEGVMLYGAPTVFVYRVGDKKAEAQLKSYKDFSDIDEKVLPAELKVGSTLVKDLVRVVVRAPASKLLTSYIKGFSRDPMTKEEIYHTYISDESLIPSKRVEKILLDGQKRVTLKNAPFRPVVEVLSAEDMPVVNVIRVLRTWAYDAYALTTPELGMTLDKLVDKDTLAAELKDASDYIQDLFKKDFYIDELSAEFCHVTVNELITQIAACADVSKDDWRDEMLKLHELISGVEARSFVTLNLVAVHPILSSSSGTIRDIKNGSFEYLELPEIFGAFKADYLSGVVNPKVCTNLNSAMKLYANMFCLGLDA